MLMNMSIYPRSQSVFASHFEDVIHINLKLVHIPLGFTFIILNILLSSNDFVSKSILPLTKMAMAIAAFS